MAYTDESKDTVNTILDMLGGHGLNLDGSGTGLGSGVKDFEVGQSSYTDLFSKELVEKGIINRRDCIARPLALNNNGPMQVEIPREGDYFLDPSSIRVHADFKIKKQVEAAGGIVDLTEGDREIVAPINLFTKALFRNIDVYINQTKVSLVSTPAYPIKAFIETVCSYGQDAEAGHLASSYWKQDTPGAKDDIDANDAFGERHDFIALSGNVEMCDTLHTELNTLNRLIPPGVDIQFIFELNNPSYYLQSVEPAVQGEGNQRRRPNPDSYFIQFTDFYLAYDRVALEPSILSSIETRLNRNDKAIFPITRSVIKTRNVPAQQRNLLWSNLYSGQLPETVIIGMMDTNTYNGAQFNNYFNFKSSFLSDVQLRLNSRAMPAMPIKLDAENSKAYRAYRHFQDNIGIENSNLPCLVSYEDFCKGTTLIPFDLTPDKAATHHNHEKQTGNIELDLKFSRALPANITVFALCVFDDKFLITGPRMNREVILNPNLI